MKYALIVADGMADEPIESLGGRTPLEAAHTPNMDALAQTGRVGQVRLIPQSMDPGSDVANLSLFGYDPAKFYTGRAPIEAASLGLQLADDDCALRCNLVTLDEGRMIDYSAGHISTREAVLLIDFLNEKLGSAEVSFHPGVSYRHIVILRGVGRLDLDTTPPHDITGKKVSRYLPKGVDAETILDLMQRAEALLESHDVNVVRRDLGENPATNIWLWGQGGPLRLESFQHRFGLSGALISAVDLLKGLAVSAGLDVITVPGATGYLDTDYVAKGKYASRALADYDIVIVHVEAPDEASHEGDVSKKIAAIERIDADVVGPLWETLKAAADKRVLGTPDPATPMRRRTHAPEPVPFVLCGSSVPHVVTAPMNEKSAQESDLKIDVGHELMSYFLGK